MLQEIASTHRANHRKPKRWFTDANMDLFVWFEEQRPVCFQLSYKQQQQEHSISWHINAGLSHTLINHQTSYPANDDFNPSHIARDFLRASNNIETALADFIFARLIEYPHQLDIRPNQAIAAKDLQSVKIKG